MEGGSLPSPLAIVEVGIPFDSRAVINPTGCMWGAHVGRGRVAAPRLLPAPPWRGGAAGGLSEGGGAPQRESRRGPLRVPEADMTAPRTCPAWRRGTRRHATLSPHCPSPTWLPGRALPPLSRTCSHPPPPPSADYGGPPRCGKRRPKPALGRHGRRLQRCSIHVGTSGRRRQRSGKCCACARLPRAWGDEGT